MHKQESILIVEDDYDIARIMSDHLRKEGYDTTWASTGKEGFEDFKVGEYSLVIVDLMLPEMDGFSLCEKIRLESEVPLLIVSARLEEENKVRGLGLGADDYLTKPFGLAELSARIRSHLRRYRRYMIQDEEEIQRFSRGLAIDYVKRVVYLNGAPLMLTAKEIDVLFLLARNPFQTFTKVDIYEHIWQQEDSEGNNTVTVHIKSLRDKLKDQTRASKFIQTVWGEGYRFIGDQLS
ncbi:response regulator transcription factor [Bacillus massiliigorillae]|uniref:response regulator transcription factor n=1 Tax=Bacillus massiliigorillae TaxID=1243664 RepID=UPI00039EEAD1|nr:response regulator transcription factor [Bacillus massiliigorillae]